MLRPLMLSSWLFAAGFLWSSALSPLADTNPVDRSAATEVDRIFTRWSGPGSPGCAVGVVQRGELVFEKGYGLANLEHDIPNTPTTVFYVASTSKQFTAAAIGLLLKRGKISLEDEVRRYVPELPEYPEPVRVRHLLYHTSGISDYLELFALAGVRLDDVHSESEIVEMLSRQVSLNFEPGTRFQYSNSGYFLLGLIVKRVSGKSLRQFASEEIFQPLGMRDTRFHDERTELVKRRASGYYSRKEGEYRNYLTHFDEVGDGGLMTTVRDLFLWDSEFYRPRLEEGTLTPLLTSPGTLDGGQSLNYAFGLALGEHRGLRMFSHGGSFLGFKSEFLRLPERDLSVICLCNHSGIEATRLARQVADVYLGLTTVRESQVSGNSTIVGDSEAARGGSNSVFGKDGLFREPVTGSLWKFSKQDEQLVASVDGQKVALVPAGENRFRSVDAPIDLDIRFDPLPRGEAPRVRLQVEGQAPVQLEPLQPLAPSASQLGLYAGNYYSEELQVTYQLFVHEKALFLRVRNASDAPVTPVVSDVFRVEGKNLLFSRDQQHRIAGFWLSNGRIRGLWYSRLVPE
ncbi:MAG: serine hydrolase domain-containing protein [Acidobacteriota bacterium]